MKAAGCAAFFIGYFGVKFSDKIKADDENRTHNPSFTKAVLYR